MSTFRRKAWQNSKSFMEMVNEKCLADEVSVYLHCCNVGCHQLPATKMGRFSQMIGRWTTYFCLLTLLDCLQSPARYLGNEFGAVRPAWESADVRFSLTYPESYEVGASNLGHIILYSVLNDSPGLLCDRAYFPGIISPPPQVFLSLLLSLPLQLHL